MRARLTRGLRNLSDESGQALVLAALGMVALLGFVALAVDVGQLRYAKRQLQMAADAAAIAAALEIVPCAGNTNCSIMTAAIQSSLTENGFPGSTLNTHCASPSGTGLQLTVNNGPCSLGSQDPNSGKTNYVEVVLQKTFPMYFARALGLSSMSISVRAEAALSDNGYCIYALDKTSSGSLVTNPGTIFGSTCAIMVESSSPNAAICNFSTVSVSFVAIVGGGQSNGCIINIRYAIGVPLPTPSDPLASVPVPAIPACGISTISPYHGSASALTISGPAILYPDFAYCGGITINSSANVTLMPGTYVLTSTNLSVSKPPGGLFIQIGATITGKGVMFYNYGPSGGITMVYNSPTLVGPITLTAPTGGTYSGILFFQDTGNTSVDTIAGAALWSTVLEGAYYFPSAQVNYSYSGTVAYNLLIAKDITVVLASCSGCSNVIVGQNNNYSSITASTPPTAAGAVLVQ